MSLSAETISRASSLQEASRVLKNHVLSLTVTNSELRAAAVSLRRWTGVPCIAGGATAAPKICPICEGPILAEDVVVSARARPTVHLLCWSSSRPAVSGMSVASQPSGDGALESPKDPHATRNQIAR
jgi:hypothetical protein